MKRMKLFLTHLYTYARIKERVRKRFILFKSFIGPPEGDSLDLLLIRNAREKLKKNVSFSPTDRCTSKHKEHFSMFRQAFLTDTAA